MGGGDLNQKKSWHPSTMKNMEKVWKAEQKHSQEQKRISELKHEIHIEKEKEEIQKYAEDRGVIEKKDDHKLEWMYKGPGELVNREEYLLGRAIDKTFEQLEQTEKPSTSLSLVASTEIDTVQNSTFSVQQVDLARKLQEDPLFAIRKKEIETRSQILKNPVKLKKLRELMVKSHTTKKTKKNKKEKRKKKKKKHSSENEDSDSDIDNLLLAKYRKLKDKFRNTDITELSKISSDSDSESVQNYKVNESKKRKHNSSDIDYRSEIKNFSKNQRVETHKPRDGSTYQQRPKVGDFSAVNKNWQKNEKRKLTEEEMERRRAEMMDNAQWREKEREKNIARKKEEEEHEKKQMKHYDTDFLRKQLSHAASQGTVAGRIRSNINNIQRSGMAMDKNFARR